MCWMCDERGEGMIWYLNPKNHARRMYRLRKAGEKPEEEITFEGKGVNPILGEAIEAKCEGDLDKYAELAKKADEMFLLQGGTCQVLPLGDCFKVVDIASPVAAMACECRKRTRATEENEKTYSCAGLGTGMLKWERWPERYRGWVKFMSPDEAKQWLTYWDKRGMVHMIMNYGGAIGGICNCDYPDCLIIRYRLDYDQRNALLKAEYVATVYNLPRMGPTFWGDVAFRAERHRGRLADNAKTCNRMGGNK